MKRYVLALDFGASSGRAMLASYDGTVITRQEVHRFGNEPLSQNGKLYWNVPKLMAELKLGMKKAYQIAPYESIGIDTWGVDFGYVGQGGTLAENPRHYRDGRSNGYAEKATSVLSPADLYRRTGTQIMDINTLFQLMSQRDTEGFLANQKLLPMPDLFAYLLTGTVSAERSIASTTQMLSAKTGDWDTELLKRLDIPTEILPPLVESGTEKGLLSDAICKELQLPPIPVTAVCGHDTQCAAFAAPAKTEDYIFLSCGTWSLFGTECDKPILTEQAAQLGLSNEVGYGKKVTFLKNIIGLWLLQESRREYIRQGQSYSFAEIEQMAVQSGASACVIDPDDVVFTPPGDIPERIRTYCRQTGQPVPTSDGAVFRCIYESLAMKYRMALDELEQCTGKHFPVIHLVGGGARDHLLCQMTANFCQRPVVAGPVEATVYGNAAIQLLAIGAIATPEEARQCIANSEPLQTYSPAEFPAQQYTNFQRIVKTSEGLSCIQK